MQRSTLITQIVYSVAANQKKIIIIILCYVRWLGNYVIFSELKVVITLPLQTISAASEWFTSSVDKVVGYEDRILWKDGTSENPPPVSIREPNEVNTNFNNSLFM